jgi:hypothetical protein
MPFGPDRQPHPILPEKSTIRCTYLSRSSICYTPEVDSLKWGSFPKISKIIAKMVMSCYFGKNAEFMKKKVLRVLMAFVVNILFWGAVTASFFFTHKKEKDRLKYNDTPHQSVTKRTFQKGYETYQITTTIDTLYMPIDSTHYDPLEPN